MEARDLSTRTNSTPQLFGFRRGMFYTFSVPTEDYIQPDTHLDRLRGVALQVEWAANYGQSAAMMRVCFLALEDFTALSLLLWGSDWVEHADLPNPPGLTIPADQRGESWAVETGDRFLSAVDKTADQTMEAVESVGSTLKTIAGIALFGGAALVVLQLLGRRTK